MTDNDKNSTATPVGLDAPSLERLLPKQSTIVLVCDVVESVRWMEHDEDQAIARWSQFAAAVRGSIAPAYSGEVIKSTGDGLMMQFQAAPLAVAAAGAMQKIANEGNQGFPPERQMHLRFGIHQTEARRDAHDLYGHGVNLAARITSLAGPGEIIVTPEVRDHLTDELDGQIEDMGECYLKHLRAPQRVYRVGAAGRPSAKDLPSFADALMPTIAVVPFQNLSGREDQNAVGDLIADGVIGCLVRSEELRVLSRLSTMSFKERGLGLQEMARPLGATHLMTGSFYAEGGSILVMAELTRVHDARVLWSERKRVSIDDLFQVDSELASSLANGFHATLLQSEAKRALTQPLSTLAGYSLLLGSIAMMHRQSTASFDQAKQLLLQLQERYPRRAIPRAWLGKWYALGSAQGWVDSAILAPGKVLQDMDRAIDLEADLALSWTIKGLIQGYVMRDFEAARKAYDQALFLNGNDALTWLYRATLAAWTADGESARECASKALALSRLDPSRYYYESLAGTALIASGAYSEAATLAKSSLRANAAHASTYKTLLLALALDGKLSEAAPVAQQVLARDPGFSVRSFLDKSPMAQSSMGAIYASAYRSAGIPQHT